VSYARPFVRRAYGERLPDVNQADQPTEQLLQQIMSDVAELKARHGWKSDPRRRMAYLLGEALELAEEVLQLPASGPYEAALLQRIGREIYDVLWNACDLARLTGIDVVQAAADKRDLNADRVWPSQRGQLWRGVVIAEGLRDPKVINNLHVGRAHITGDDLPLDERGTRGRWHLYWVDLTSEQIDLIQAQTLRGWYAHFWAGSQLVVVYDDARFEMTRDDPAAWEPAIKHGLGQGLRREWLDFPTDETTGDLE
jgi:NTP pyrophosphatase (non-canonical NTP hydrolase)